MRLLTRWAWKCRTAPTVRRLFQMSNGSQLLVGIFFCFLRRLLFLRCVYFNTIRDLNPSVIVVVFIIDIHALCRVLSAILSIREINKQMQNKKFDMRITCSFVYSQQHIRGVKIIFFMLRKSRLIFICFRTLCIIRWRFWLKSPRYIRPYVNRRKGRPSRIFLNVGIGPWQIQMDSASERADKRNPP